jgi:hypothetical protein
LTFGFIDAENDAQQTEKNKTIEKINFFIKTSLEKNIEVKIGFYIKSV